MILSIGLWSDPVLAEKEKYQQTCKESPEILAEARIENAEPGLRSWPG